MTLDELFSKVTFNYFSDLRGICEPDSYDVEIIEDATEDLVREYLRDCHFNTECDRFQLEERIDDHQVGVDLSYYLSIDGHIFNLCHFVDLDDFDIHDCGIDVDAFSEGLDMEARSEYMTYCEAHELADALNEINDETYHDANIVVVGEDYNDTRFKNDKRFYVRVERINGFVARCDREAREKTYAFIDDLGNTFDNIVIMNSVKWTSCECGVCDNCKAHRRWTEIVFYRMKKVNKGEKND